MSWVLEQPIPIVILGLLMEAMLFAGLYNTGRRSFIWAMAGVLVLTLSVLGLNLAIVTPFEEVRNTLKLVARAIEQDDQATVLAHISAKAPALRQAAKDELKNFRVTTVSIKRNLAVTFTPPSKPREAAARFNLVCEGSTRGGVTITGTYAATLEVKLIKEEGQWRVLDYKESSPIEGLREKK